ncbi:uncharacterized protein K02A2.6-like [Sitodiplosis mosellana]|uniref:uncharacterized protein K02A2.6-like n=1 Tax=Sitodiplosis mosellana TaxID=263140 RepID=UPI0024441065|nr:uncharacterized protein K02A2.6-like [Sitodiplosis mosellana]
MSHLQNAIGFTCQATLSYKGRHLNVSGGNFRIDPIHRRSAPYHPATNGQAEKYVQMLKDKLKALKSNTKNLDRDVTHILLCYRRMQHSATGESPSQRMFNRQIRSRLDLLLPNHNTQTKETPPEVTRKFQVGERVSVRDYADKKYQFGRIHEVLGKLHYHVLLDDGRMWKRHTDQIHRVGEEIKPTQYKTTPKDENIADSNTNPKHTSTHTPNSPPQATVTTEAYTEPVIDPEPTVSSDNTLNSTPIATGLPPISEFRRSNRVRNTTQRLAYDNNFNQI